MLKTSQNTTWQFMARLAAVAILTSFVTRLERLATAGENARTTPVEKARSAEPNTSTETDSEKQKRLREGTVLNERLGRFRSAEAMFWFRDLHDGRELRVLENLALERVARALHELPQTRTWAVTGTVTEYQGENYLLITRAVLKSVAESAGVGIVE